jgi:hypothetical protein
MVDPNTSIADAIRTLEREVSTLEKKREQLVALKALVSDDEAAAFAKKKSIADHMAEIFVEAKRPLTAAGDIVPALEKRGVKFSEGTIPSLLAKDDRFEKVERGLWKLADRK